MPKRTKPIQRDEIRFGGRYITTAPAGTMRKDRHGGVKPTNPKLWAPLLRSLDQQEREMWEGWVKRGLSSADDPPKPVTAPQWREAVRCYCRQCLRWFYRERGYNCGEYIYCSDKCVAAARRVAMAPVVKARSQARAAARANRKCAACGKPIKAKRSTMRFCSIRCRVASHRNTGHK
jgi:hypothetical protein